MANRDTRFLIKRSNVPGKIPTNGDLLLGELGLNTADAILYTSGTTANTILPIGWDRVARTGDTMTGGLFTTFLSATTVSATTYLNLPTFTGLTANTIYTDYIDFNTNYTGATLPAGRLQWDDGNGTLVLGLKGGLSNIEVGLENMALCYNDETTPLTAGTIVYVSGSQGNRPKIKRGLATSDGYSVTTLGMVSETIAPGGEGFITTFGMVNNLNTLGLSGGTPIWLSPTVVGGYTATKPQAPYHTVLLGYVVRVSATVGSIFVHISNGWEIDELHDVRLNGRTVGDLLSLSGYNGSNVWVNSKTLNGSYTITGDTTVGGQMIATSVSATTYYNLPIDVYTTGGTRVDSSLIFTNNTGGTFTVTGVTPSLQEVYTASTAPRITTNNTLGSLRIRGGTGSDLDNNFIIENNIGDVTSYWSANGDLVLQTISATTYYNLPLDVYVTGGSYNQISGIATFTNNSGGTFTVDGFSTGGGGSFTGGTVTGPTNFLDGLSANTISATTYYNLPIDVYVTGGTYSNGSATFTNNTGGTFNVTGLYTGSTDVYVTGGTYTDGITTFTNTTGGTFNVTSTTTYAAGVISGSTGWSSTGTGQINLPNVKVALYNNANNIEPILIYDVASGTTNSGGIPTLANNDTNYIVIEYNGGSPIYNVYDNDSIVNDSSVVLFMVVYRADNFIHTLEFGNQGAGLANKLNDRFIMTDRIGYESGLALGLSGSTGIVTSTAGVAWNGPNRQFLDPVNSQDDIFFKSFHSGGTWVYTTTGDTLNNTYYDDGTDIVLATAGKYLTNWYFRGQEINDHLYEVYSTNQYDSVALAQLSTEPVLPELITSHAILLGRIIVQVNATTGLTESAFTVPFQPTQVAYHNDLNGIQGGSAGQYYHLNANQYNNIALTNVDNNFSVGQTFNSGITANTISATTVTANSSSLVSMSATTLSGGTIYGDGSNITNIPVPYGIINALANFNFLT